MFEVKISTEGAAFKSESDDAYFNRLATKAEVVFLLRKILEQIKAGYTEHSVIDENGNKVGEWRLDI